MAHPWLAFSSSPPDVIMATSGGMPPACTIASAALSASAPRAFAAAFCKHRDGRGEARAGHTGHRRPTLACLLEAINATSRGMAPSSATGGPPWLAFSSLQPNVNMATSGGMTSACTISMTAPKFVSAPRASAAVCKRAL